MCKKYPGTASASDVAFAATSPVSSFMSSHGSSFASSCGSSFSAQNDAASLMMTMPRPAAALEERQVQTKFWSALCAGSLKSASAGSTDDIMRKIEKLRTDENSVMNNASISSSEGRKVRLHVYDVSEGYVQRMNKLFAHTKMPVKLGGMFHVGVEVYGIEWAYGFTDDSSAGVWISEPKRNPQHCFRQTVELGETKLSRRALARLMSDMREDYPGRNYNLLCNNCCDFAEDMCKRMGVAGFPKWVNRLARMAATVDSVIHLRSSGPRGCSK